MRIAISIFAPVLYILASFITLSIDSSSHNVAKFQTHVYDIFIIAGELIIYYLSFHFSKKMNEGFRTFLIAGLAAVFSVDCGWRMLLFNYSFVDVPFDIISHFILLDFIPLYILILITWTAGKTIILKKA
jgi:hypothetical protein